MTKQQIKIPLSVLSSNEKDRETWEDGETTAFWEVENNKVVFSLKITKIGSDNWSANKWERNFQLFSTYTIEPIELTFLDKVKNVENNKIKIVDLLITYKNLKSEIPNLEETFHKGAEIKLELGDRWYDDSESRWFLRDHNDDNSFSLEVYYGFEIITPNKTISFPLLTFDDRQNEELWDKWYIETEDWYNENQKNSKKTKKNYQTVKLDENSIQREKLVLQIIQELQTKKLIECEKINQLEKILNNDKKQKLTEAVFENIKKFSENWKIKKILTTGYDSCPSYKIMLIHQSAELKWEKDFFNSEQWKELEQIIPFSSEKQAEINSNSKSRLGKIFFTLLLWTIVGGAMIIFLVLLIKRKFFNRLLTK